MRLWPLTIAGRHSTVQRDRVQRYRRERQAEALQGAAGAIKTAIGALQQHLSTIESYQHELRTQQRLEEAGQ